MKFLKRIIVDFTKEENESTQCTFISAQEVKKVNSGYFLHAQIKTLFIQGYSNLIAILRLWGNAVHMINLA